MNRRKAVFAVVFAVSMLIGIQAVGIVDANPVPWSSIPNLEKPTVTLENLQNYTTYNDGKVNFDFTVVAPSSWNKVHWFTYYVGRIASVNVYLDGNLIDCNRVYLTSSRFSEKLNRTTSGQHLLNITVQSYTYYAGQIYDNSSIVSDITDINTINGVEVRNTIYEYPIVVSDIVYFTVVGGPSPSPSPSPTPSPSPSPLLQETRSFPDATLATASLATVAVVGVGLLIYSKNRKRGKMDD